MVIAALFVGAAVSNAAAQSATAGIVSSPCPPPDPAAEARLKPIDDLFMTPAASPDAFWAAFAKLQATVLAGDAERNRAQQAADWPNLCRYKAANATLARGPRPRAVFMGDSITDNWVRGDPALFADGIVGRGIGGQTSPQMLARFRQDVVALRPRVVHIMAGTNDIAGNTGPTTLQDYQHNILAMIDLARVNDIAVVLAAIPPSRKLFWRDDLDPRPQIREWNEWLRGLAFGRGLTFVDYGMVLADPDGGMRADLGNDGVHPNRLGYARMRSLAERAVAEAVERADAPAGARVSVARREALLRQVAASVSAVRERPPSATQLAPPPTPLTNSRAWNAAERIALWPAAPPNGTFVPATLPAAWPAPFVANVASPELRVFPAQRPTGQAVLVVPGGGYQFVSVENEGAEFAARLNERGYTVFVLVYGFRPKGGSEARTCRCRTRSARCVSSVRTPHAGRSMRARWPSWASPRADISRRHWQPTSPSPSTCRSMVRMRRVPGRSRRRSSIRSSRWRYRVRTRRRASCCLARIRCPHRSRAAPPSSMSARRRRRSCLCMRSTTRPCRSRIV